ncbi:glycerophosphodiester phosphodiesterase [Staphylococcus felis]|uniref:glycerophosphodiester phosphodiesterase n=1 Tax=Staphylococcus felis TaxID=46127 RepID=UPI000E22DEB7|nr:glycerophosphodiester phosphodiesterase [Staphylococcus felis]REH79960.1 glycerophosphodiester phosphodiesterase [Staphylococcus felis]REH96734.1 glycerophosphodiester phosphodiesterase [Staphylococcus felis]REI04186.1 glycerophosphodiester phosphodiesterase [Staphylococcus felis]REI24785.1 glycerophosphodiester phosphodiesterase [Staphylococcus felis]REI30875.1 glycerophosphodiester phosphodiesterase [Staphylococcus felis]
MTKTNKCITRAIMGISGLFGSLLLLKKFKNKPVPREIKPFFKHEAPYIFSHRGGMKERPESTFLAFDHSVKLGLTGFETDIRITKDEKVIIFHDADVDRTTNGSGLVSNHTLTELKQLDAGFHFTDINGNKPYRNHKNAKIITLEELLQRYPNQLVNIDIKDHPNSYEGRIAAKCLYDVIKKQSAEDRVLVTSFYKAQIERFNLYNHHSIAVGASQAEVTDAILKLYTGLSQIYDGTADTFQMPTSFKGIPLAQPTLVNWLNKRHIAPGFYGVNSVDQMQDLINMGVHTIVTDRPEVGAQFLNTARSK